jgi:hypothetical protein
MWGETWRVREKGPGVELERQTPPRRDRHGRRERGSARAKAIPERGND